MPWNTTARAGGVSPGVRGDLKAVMVLLASAAAADDDDDDDDAVQAKVERQPMK